MTRMRQAYISCALTHVPERVFTEYSDFIKSLEKFLLEKYAASVKYALRDSDPQLANIITSEKASLCYIMDKQMVEDSDLVIAEVSFPSGGVGIELQIAQQKSIPIILLYKDFGFNIAAKKTYILDTRAEYSLQIGNGIVSLMIQGLPNIIREIKYTDYVECISELDKYMHNWK